MFLSQKKRTQNNPTLILRGESLRYLNSLKSLGQTLDFDLKTAYPKYKNQTLKKKFQHTQNDQLPYLKSF